MANNRIELHNVSKSFGEVDALIDINFVLGENEVVGLVELLQLGEPTAGGDDPSTDEEPGDGVRGEDVPVRPHALSAEIATGRLRRDLEGAQEQERGEG